MKSQWNFYFESKGFRFDRTHKYEGEIGSEQASAFGFSPEKFTFQMIIEPDEKPRFAWMQQTGTLKVILPGDMDQTKDLAHWIASHSSEQITFSSGELKLLGGLVTGEYMPETPEEENQLGENRFFATVSLVEAVPPDTFDGASLQKIAGSSAIGKVMRQFNAALKASTLSG